MVKKEKITYKRLWTGIYPGQGTHLSLYKDSWGKYWLDLTKNKNEESFILRQKRDGIKKKFCEENNIGYIQILYNQNIREYLEVYFYEKL